MTREVGPLYREILAKMDYCKEINALVYAYGTLSPMVLALGKQFQSYIPLAVFDTKSFLGDKDFYTPTTIFITPLKLLFLMFFVKSFFMIREYSYLSSMLISLEPRSFISSRAVCAIANLEFIS